MRSGGTVRPRTTLARKGRTSSARVGPPKASSSTPSAGMLPRRQLVDGVDQRAHVIDRGLGQDAVAQVEDVPGATRRLVEDGGGARADLRDGCEQRRRVEVPLYRDVVAEARPRGVEVDAPVEADHVAARGAQGLEEPGRPGTEVD